MHITIWHAFCNKNFNLQGFIVALQKLLVATRVIACLSGYRVRRVSRTHIPKDARFPAHIAITRDSCFSSVMHVSLAHVSLGIRVSWISCTVAVQHFIATVHVHYIAK